MVDPTLATPETFVPESGSSGRRTVTFCPGCPQGSREPVIWGTLLQPRHRKVRRSGLGDLRVAQFEVGGGSNRANSAASGASKTRSHPSKSARRMGRWPRGAPSSGLRCGARVRRQARRGSAVRRRHQGRELRIASHHVLSRPKPKIEASAHAEAQDFFGETPELKFDLLPDRLVPRGRAEGPAIRPS